MKKADKNTHAEYLLKSIARDEERKKRGHLRIFLGMCPGVGKTYAMLQAAQERLKSGINPLVGIVETHGRIDTEALLKGLEILPRKKMDYRGKVFQELDVDAILARKPELVLVDELAHTNIPGSRHPKRYHDVKEILDAGIDVYTTVNVQHLESRIDQVRQITGVSVHEIVPDSFFELADQIELVDLPPSELLKRLKEGKVYIGDMAAKAIEGFFQEEHLLALRELALRFTAELVEGELHHQMMRKQISGPWQTREKLLVAVSHSPYSKRLIRATRRKAFNLEASWIALYVDTGEALTEEDKVSLRKNLDMAQELGAELVCTRENDVPSAIRRIAEEKNVTQIIMGRPDKRFFRDLFNRGTILDKLVRETSEIDIHVLRQVRKPRIKVLKFKFPALEPFDDLASYSNTFWFMALVGMIGWGIEPYVQYQSVGFLFLLAVIAVSVFSRRGPTLFAAILGALTWNYFFIPPKFTLFIQESEDLMMHVTYFAVAIAASYLTSKIRRQAEELKKRAHQTSLLYDFSRELASSQSLDAIIKTTCQFVERTLNGSCQIVLQNGSKRVFTDSIFQLSEKQMAVVHWVKQNGKRAGFGTETLAGSDVFCLPILGTAGVLGVLAFLPKEGKTVSVEDESTLQSMCASVAISLERDTFQKQAETLRIVEASEKLYQTILDSVSHELRTPVTLILGAASALQDTKTVQNEDNRKMLTEEIIRGTQRLNHVIENLLDTSRISTGKLNFKKELVELGESIESMVQEWKLREQVSVPVLIKTEEVYAECDTQLLKNALENLLHNAAKHSQGKAIQVEVKKSKNQVWINVVDEGKGIPDDEKGKIFQKFYRIQGAPSGGIGLGLSIVKGILELHGGDVEVLNNPEREGSIFRISLPRWMDELPKV